MTGLEEHYQKIFQKEKEDFRLKALLDLIAKLIPPKAEILDLGCGSAFFSVALAERGYQVTAVDSSSGMIQMARKRKKINRIGSMLKIIKIKAQKIAGLSQKFDLILILDVLEHIKDDRQILKIIRELLRPQGKIILSLPAHPYLFGKRDKKVGHYRRYSKKMIKKLLLGAGYSIKKLRYWNFLGLIIYFVSEKILKKSINEKIRYNDGLKAKMIKGLIYNLLKLENHLAPPLGLSLIVIARKN